MEVAIVSIEKGHIVEQFNHFVFELNNRIQHLPFEVRQQRMKQIIEDVERLEDGEESHIFTPLCLLCDDDNDDTEELACENAVAREQRIRELQAFYNVPGEIDEEEQERELAIKNRCGKTDLHDAVLMGDCDLIRTLIQNGADINAKNNNGQTAVYLAFLEENEEVISLLRELKVIPSIAQSN